VLTRESGASFDDPVRRPVVRGGQSDFRISVETLDTCHSTSFANWLSFPLDMKPWYSPRSVAIVSVPRQLLGACAWAVAADYGEMSDGRLTTCRSARDTSTRRSIRGPTSTVANIRPAPVSCTCRGSSQRPSTFALVDLQIEPVGESSKYDASLLLQLHCAGPLERTHASRTIYPLLSKVHDANLVD
jgi:hypothetical protein